MTCPKVVVVHDRVEEWATFIGVDVPDVDGEGVKIDAAVAANILTVSLSFHFIVVFCSVPNQTSSIAKLLGIEWDVWRLVDCWTY